MHRVPDLAFASPRCAAARALFSASLGRRGLRRLPDRAHRAGARVRDDDDVRHRCREGGRRDAGGVVTARHTHTKGIGQWARGSLCARGRSLAAGGRSRPGGCERRLSSVSGQSASIVGFTVMTPSCHRTAPAVAERPTGPGGPADVRRQAAQAGSKAASTTDLPDWLITHPAQSRPTGFSKAAVRWGRCLLGCASTKRPSVNTARRPSAGFGSRCATARGRPNAQISVCARNVDSRRNQSFNLASPE